MNKLKRYNFKDYPVDMIESDDGFWIKYEDAVHIIEYSISMSEYYQKKFYSVDEEAFELTKKVLQFKSASIGLSILLFFVTAILISVKL